jgi:hypothetical protein
MRFILKELWVKCKVARQAMAVDRSEQRFLSAWPWVEPTACPCFDPTGHEFPKVMAGFISSAVSYFENR